MSIVAVALDASSASQTTQVEEPEKKASVSLNSKLLFLIPAITGIALGILCIPHFGLGMAVGAIDCAIMVVSLVVWNAVSASDNNEKEETSAYQKALEDSLLYVSVFGPIAEEGIFRGIVQPLLTRAIQIIVPAAAAVAFGPFSIAATVSIIASGIFFGAVHYSNNHKNSHIQAGMASITGVVYGALAAQFGIGASIAAHIANNTIVSFLMAVQSNKSDRSIEFSIPA